MAKPGKKRERKCVPKAERRNLRLWAEGSRETILAPHLDAYAKALDEGWQPERKLLKKICKEFHARVHWRTPDNEEPVLKDWDLLAQLVPESLTEEEERLRGERIEVLNARIRRWFVYRIRKLYKHRVSSGVDPTKNPFAVLLAKLSGVTTPPKARQAYQQFMRESYAEKIAPVVADRWASARNEDSGGASDRTKEPKAGFRAQVARDVFAALPKSEQKALSERAKANAAQAKEDYAKALKDPPSKKPEDRQRCIDALADFMAPILRGIQEYTGLHSTEIRTIHVSYGRSNTALAPHWPQWDRPRFSENVTKFMIDYLHTAFTPQDCALAALNTTESNGVSHSVDVESSDSDSDSDSDSGSNTSSDKEESARTKKKRKIARKTVSARGKSVSKAKTMARAKSKSGARAPCPATNNEMSTSTPATNNDTPTPPPATNDNIPDPPPATSNGSSAPPPTTDDDSAPGPAGDDDPAADDADDEDEDEEADDEEEAADEEEARPAPYSREEREANIRHNTAALNKLKEAWVEGGIDVDMEDGPHTWDEDVDMGIWQDTDREDGMSDAPLAPGELTTTTTPTSTSTLVPGALSTTAAPTPTPTPTFPPGISTTITATTNAIAIPAPSAPTSSTSNVAGPSPGTTTAPFAPVLQAASAAIATRITRGRMQSSTPDSEAAASSGVIPCPKNAPAWFANGYATVTQVDLGVHFQALVAAWIRVEAASRFEHGPSNLPVNGKHPKPVGEWIAKNRTR
ncbi:hypothetical protein B0H19DRAFT_1261106 [Mycena capillaripes]|nr:hypothetical protein B0H19DRAFT_1261106 [Mycena capillaripes]